MLWSMIANKFLLNCLMEAHDRGYLLEKNAGFGEENFLDVVWP